MTVLGRRPSPAGGTPRPADGHPPVAHDADHRRRARPPRHLRQPHPPSREPLEHREALTVHLMIGLDSARPDEGPGGGRLRTVPATWNQLGGVEDQEGGSAMREVLVWTATGVGAGWFVLTAMRSRRDFGLVGDLAIGGLGAVVGGWLFRQLGFVAPDNVAAHVLVALVGATMLLLAARGLRRAMRVT